MRESDEKWICDFERRRNKGTIEYRKQQFKKIEEEYIEYKTKIKIIKPNGETNWMDIENKEFDAIKKILTGGQN